MQYEKAYELRAADFDAFDRMHPASVLELLQDVAGIHANELGIGYHALIEKQTIWVLTKVRYRDQFFDIGGCSGSGDGDSGSSGGSG